MPDDSSIKKDDKELQNRINTLKAEVYELIKRQEILSLENNQIQQLKSKRVQEIESLEALHGK